MRRRRFAPWLAAAALGLCFWLPLRSAPAQTATNASHAFFIVATNGNDKWSGNRPAINSTGTDGPFATLTNALAAARAWKRSSSNGVAAIFVRGGTHFLPTPLVLKPEDSGLVLASYGTEKPVLSGGRRITGWKLTSLNGKTSWVAEVPEAKSGKWRFHELWVNGQRAACARFPEKGYLKIAAVPDKTAGFIYGNDRFQFGPGDLKLSPNIAEGEAVVMDLWVENRLPIAGLDETSRTLSFRKKSVLVLNPGDLYYLEGVLDFLQEPGQWCLDAPKGLVYYLPYPWDEISKAEFIAPVLPQIIRLEGKPETGERIHRVRFKGLTFAHTEWYYPEGFAQDAKGTLGIYPKPSEDVRGFGQAAVGVPGAVWGEGLQECSWKSCTFAHLGDYALEIARGCDRNLISKCLFFDLGAGGVKLGERVVRTNLAEQSSDNEISDCQVADGGKLYHSSDGIWIGQTANNRVIHNVVSDFYETGISAGWTWGYWPSLATNNLIAYNHIHHIGQKISGDGPTMSDMAGIYTLGKQLGTKIENNLIHDITALKYGGYGIYLDEGSSGILVESNIVYRTTHGGFHLHYGGTNGIVNNIFAFGRDMQLNRTKPEPHLSVVFMRNIVYFNSGILMGGQWPSNQARFDSNLYFDARTPGGPEKLKFGNFTWPQWRAMGNDVHSIFQNPLLKVANDGELQLSPNSPAFQLAFQPIDMTSVGVRK